MQLTAVVTLFSDAPDGPTLSEVELLAWVDRGWVRPEQSGAGPVFGEIDIARIRLIRDMRIAMHIEDDTIPTILSLLDQVYDLRSGLRAVLRAVEAQPEPVRKAILAAIG